MAVEAPSPLFEVVHRHAADGQNGAAYLDYFAAVALPRSGEKLVVEVDIDLGRELIPLIEHRDGDSEGKSAEVQLMRREGDAMVVLNEPGGQPRVPPVAGARSRIEAKLLRGTLGFVRGVVGTLWWRELHRRRAIETGQQQERAEQGHRLTELSRRVVSVQEEERRRLASELHDRTGANLATIKLNLKSIARATPVPSTDADALMEETSELLADTIVSIREFCSDLRPSILDYAGLQQAIENCVDRLVRRLGIHGEVDHARFSGRCAPEVESVLFRIVQEALLNCAKHAQARKVSVLLRGDSRRLILTVEDDGVGFDPQALRLPGRNAGNGLLSMQERAAFAGGTFAIESAPGSGTRITIEI